MNYEQDFDNALTDLCGLAALPAAKIRSTEQLKTPYVEVLFETGPSNGHIGNNGYYDMFSATVSFAVHTDRDRTGQDHYSHVTEVRRLMTEEFLTFITTNYPAYRILDIIPQGTSYDINEELDVTELRFQITFQVL